MFLDYPVTKCSRKAVYRRKDSFSWFQRVHHGSEGRTKQGTLWQRGVIVEIELQEGKKAGYSPRNISPETLLTKPHLLLFTITY